MVFPPSMELFLLLVALGLFSRLVDLIVGMADSAEPLAAAFSIELEALDESSCRLRRFAFAPLGFTALFLTR